MAQYETIITTTGAAKIAAAVASGTPNQIKQAAVGDGAGSYYSPTPAQTELRGETWRGPIITAEIDAAELQMINVRFVVPPEVGGFTVREAGLFDADGDMLAVCNLPDMKKEVYATGTTGKLTIIMHIVVTDTGALEFDVHPDLDGVTQEQLNEAIAALKRFSLSEDGMLSNSLNYGFFDDTGAAVPFYVGQSSPQATADTLIICPPSFAPIKPPQDAATLVFFSGYAADGGDTIILS